MIESIILAVGSGVVGALVGCVVTSRHYKRREAERVRLINDIRTVAKERGKRVKIDPMAGVPALRTKLLTVRASGTKALPVEPETPADVGP